MIFGAAKDDPGALADRAIKEAESALRRKDSVGFREAAEKGWLAASSSADVAADKLGMNIPGGHRGWRTTLGELEKHARLRRGSLVGTFEAAQSVLHGDCFHGDKCSTLGVLGLLDDVKELTVSTQSAINRVKKYRR